MNTFRSSDLSTIAASRALAARVFGGPEWEKEGADVYRGDPGESGVASWAIGNCHVRRWLACLLRGREDGC